MKIAATRGYGGDVVLYERRGGPTREEIGARLAAERGLIVIPPFDHPDVVAGQGTAAAELFEEVGPLDLILAPCGGGGLLSGSGIAARALSPSCRVVGVEPASADDATRSFRTRVLQTVSNPDTIADGVRTPSLRKITFPLVLQYVDDMVTVSEPAIVTTTLFLWNRLKLVVEPTGRWRRRRCSTESCLRAVCASASSSAAATWTSRPSSPAHGRRTDPEAELKRRSRAPLAFRLHPVPRLACAAGRCT